MSSTLIRALVLAVPICGLVGWSVVLVVRQRSRFTILQLVGAGFLFVTVLAHVWEGLGIFPFMGWGRRDSVGHYLDLSSTCLGVTLVVVGWLARVLPRRHQ